MKIRINSLKKPLKGKMRAPDSKSAFQRVLFAAMLSEGQTKILYNNLCDDVKSCLNIIEKAGAKSEIDKQLITVSGIKKINLCNYNCGESGLALRMFAPIASVFCDSVKLTGVRTLNKRPVKNIGDSLAPFGVQFTSVNNRLPLGLSGKLKAVNTIIDGSFGSQLLSGLLFALPLLHKDIVLLVKNLKSKPYIDLTLKVLGDFGINVENKNYESFTIKQGQKYKAIETYIEGDWSGAAFFLVAGAIHGKLEINNLQPSSTQADKKILEVLKNAGTDIIKNKNSIIVQNKKLKAFTFDATDCPDLFPPLVALASTCSGTSQIKGVHRLYHKESNRADVLKQEFNKLGITISISNDIMFIKGGNIYGGEVSSHNDHRIAAALAIAALSAEKPVTIFGAEAVNKSFPAFWTDFNDVFF